MKSAIPKPLHEVAGLSLLAHSIGSARTATAQVAVVVGAGGDKVSTAALAAAPNATIHEQTERLGTAHAVLAAETALAEATGDAVVLYADTPMISAGTLDWMRRTKANGADVVILGFHAANPGGYGRLIVENGVLTKIVEAKEATPEQLDITFCNSGVVWSDAQTLLSLLREVGNDNAKGEYYLTDIVEIANERGLTCAAVECEEAETLGVNSRADLAGAEAAFQHRARTAAMVGGATLTAPETVWFSHDTVLGRDVVVEPNVVFGPGVTVHDDARIRAHSHLEGCVVRSGAVIGPYARLRPGANIGEGARIGNFVEVKNATFGAGAKANHLAYIGDAEVGAGSNIGAGVITANYDGVFKYPSRLGENAFVGSNTTLIAPVDIGAGAYIAGGSIITGAVAEGALALSRAEKQEKPGLGARLMAKLRQMKASGQKKKGAI